MDITYDLGNNTVTINGETILIKELLDALPGEIVRYQFLINEIYINRQYVVDQVGDYNKAIAKLTFKINDYRDELAKLSPKSPDEKQMKYWNNMIMQISKQITAMKELRHGTKLNAIWEGKLMLDLESLEV